ncbi:MAG: LamG domain-containing protein [Sedimentisphaerales bacterium]
MCKRLVYLAAFVLVLSVTGRVSADLVGYWKFDEGAGTKAYDSSPQGNDGTLNGSPEWTEGQLDGALRFNGSSDYVEVPDSPSLNITGAITIAAWTYMDPAASGEMAIVSKGGWAANDLPYELTEEAGGVIFWQFYNDAGRDSCSPDSPSVDEWHHIAATYDGVIFKCYIDAELGEQWEYAGEMPINTASVTIGRRSRGGTFYNGLLDEEMLFNHALTEDEIPQIMMGLSDMGKASGPDPRDHGVHEDTWITLNWRPGAFAVSHDVYLSDNFDDVNDGAADAFRGNQTPTYYVAGFPGYAYPDGLVPGTTYYWRIDEVNEADPNSPWRGDIWSFSIPSQEAYDPNPTDGAGFVDPGVTLTWTGGFKAKLHTVYFGDDFDEVNNATTGGVMQGSPSYSPGPLESEKVYYWRVDEFDGAATYKGDVWSFTTPGAVGNPSPANGAVDVKMIATLSWTASDSAASHEVYFGVDKDAVRAADTGSPEYKGSKALGAESYDPGKLAWYTSYYWRVDEVDGQGNTLKGPLWGFTTADFLSVDDFESYTDDDAAGQAIWQSWIDGFGVAENGAQAGYLLPPYAEQTIVHGGLQSLPILYDNAPGAATYSEATLTLSYPRDWTENSVGALVIWFRGRLDNAAEPLYVSVANSSGAPAVVVHDNANVAQTGPWTKWVVPLQTFVDNGIDLTNVNSISIGLGTRGGAMTTPGGTGTMYFDDVALY